MENNINSEEEFLIDAHCHLQYFSDIELEETLINCEKSNIKMLLTNATFNDDFEKTVNIAEKHKVKVIPGVGYHPWYLDTPFTNPNWFDEFKGYIEKLNERGVKYFIGEIGIDGGRVKK